MAERTLESAAKRWAREYETIYILRPNVDSEEAEKVASRVRDVMEKTGGKLTKVDLWGKRRLAYNIGNYSRGIFVYLAYAAHNDVVAELERNLRLLETVIRYQTIRVRDGVELDDVEVDAENIEFTAIEHTEDEAEPTTAERLGMAERPQTESRASSSSDDDDEGEDKDSDSDEDSDSKDDTDTEGDDESATKAGEEE